MPSVADYLNAQREYVVRSRWSIDIPVTDLCSYLFSSPTAPLSRTPIFLAAEKPDTHNLSLHSYRRLVKKIARGLRDAGLSPGQRVLAFSGNNVFYPSLYLGILAAGGVFTGANPTYTTRELAFQLKDSGSVFCITSRASIDIAVEAADLVGLQRRCVFVFDDGLLLGDVNGGTGTDRWISNAGEEGRKWGVRHWSELVSEREDFEWKVFTTMEEVNQTAAVNYSSGCEVRFPLGEGVG
jgi:4-coumarate--CoA ligase